MNYPRISAAAFVVLLFCHTAAASTFVIPNGNVGALKAAIITSNSNGQDDVIELAAGGSYPLTTSDHVGANGSNGLPSIGPDGGKKLLLRGHGATVHRSTNSGTARFRIFSILAGANVSMSGLTITNGYGTMGGAIAADGATVELSNCTITRNFADSFSDEAEGLGGGIYNRVGTLTVIDSTIIGNEVRSRSSEGGGIYNDHGTVLLHRSAVNENMSDCSGGAIWNTGGNVTITDSSVSGNRSWACYSGGVFSNGNLRVERSTFNRNDMAITTSGSATVINSTFDRNHASNSGGAIYNLGTLNVSQSTFTGNSGDSGGAIATSRPSLNAVATASVSNCTFDGNIGRLGDGSAIVNGNGCTTRLVNSTFNANTGSEGYGSGAIWNAGTFEIGNTILKRVDSAANLTGTGITSLGYNISNDSGSGFLTATGDRPSTEPLLDPAGLQDNGGTTLTIALQSGSPALDTGKNFAAAQEDQRGYRRPYDNPQIANAIGGDGSDIGAVEKESGTRPTPTGAVFIAQQVPSRMVPGQSYDVQVTMKNTGTTAWTYAARYKLGSENALDDTTWGLKRVRLPQDVSVAPGATYTFAFRITAPAEGGTYDFQWGMLQEGVRHFGEKTPNVAVHVGNGIPVRDAAFISQSVPSRVMAGEKFSVYITMKNTGTTTWKFDYRYKLASGYWTGNMQWGRERVRLPQPVVVPPGAVYTFTFFVTAPTKPGLSHFQWQMLQENEAWFGDPTTPLIVTVLAP